MNLHAGGRRSDPEIERERLAEGHILTAGGLTSGIDAALHVVARLLDESVPERTARYMEYQGDGWRTGEMPLAD